jgi:nucleoside-diphosphate-sugar epimerase
MSIAEVAGCVAGEFQPNTPVQKQGVPDMQKSIERYVPSTARAREELGLKQFIDLRMAIRQTLNWHKATAKG